MKSVDATVSGLCTKWCRGFHVPAVPFTIMQARQEQIQQFECMKHCLRALEDDVTPHSVSILAKTLRRVARLQGLVDWLLQASEGDRRGMLQYVSGRTGLGNGRSQTVIVGLF